MPTVRELAAEFGASPGLVLKALQSLAVYAEGPHSNISDHHAQRFRDEYGEKIRKAKPKAEIAAVLADVTDAAPPAGKRFRVPDDHVIRVAHAHVGVGRRPGNPDSMVTAADRFPILSKTPGQIHAIDLLGTREGDPWRGERVAGEHKTFTHPGPPAACGKRIRAVLSDEFALDTPNPCPRCLEAFESGRAMRYPPSDYFARYDCNDYVRVTISGVEVIEHCCLHDLHRGRHRSDSGATWDKGASDYKASPSDTWLGHG